MQNRREKQKRRSFPRLRGLRDERGGRFGEKYPELQDELLIVALGSVWQDRSGYRNVSCLYGVGSERYLNLDWAVDDWFKFYRFAAVRK